MSKINYYLSKKILIIESTKDDVNKTWCFWDSNDSKWNSFLSKKWSEINFKSSDVNLDFKLNKMTYNISTNDHTIHPILVFVFVLQIHVFCFMLILVYFCVLHYIL